MHETVLKLCLFTQKLKLLIELLIRSELDFVLMVDEISLVIIVICILWRKP